MAAFRADLPGNMGSWAGPPVRPWEQDAAPGMLQIGTYKQSAV